MWFRFPPGASGCQVQLQNFAVEVTDREGRGYFRAPNHFAALILDMPGYAAAEPPEDANAPADLPQPDPLRDGAIASLGAELERSRSELQTLREDSNVLRAALNAMTAERDNAARLLEKANARIAELEEDEVDEPAGQLA